MSTRRRSSVKRLLHSSLLGLRAVTLFAIVELGLRNRSLDRLCRLLRVRLGGSAPRPARPARVVPRREVRAAMRAVAQVSERWPWGDTCLRRCLVLGALLSRAHPVLVIGVNRSGGGAIGAHAWLEFNGLSIDPLSTHFSAMPL